MLGNVETIDAITGDIALIESFGTINTTFNDAEGNRYHLTDNQTATIRIPLATGSTNPPARLSTDAQDIIQDSCITLEPGVVITLTWGENPRDLNRQLFGPNSADDVTSYGPEVTTISSFSYAGRTVTQSNISVVQVICGLP